MKLALAASFLLSVPFAAAAQSSSTGLTGRLQAGANTDRVGSLMLHYTFATGLGPQGKAKP